MAITSQMSDRKQFAQPKMKKFTRLQFVSPQNSRRNSPSDFRSMYSTISRKASSNFVQNENESLEIKAKQVIPVKMYNLPPVNH